MNTDKAILIFNNYINGNNQDFIKDIKKLNKVDLLTCIDLLIEAYGFEYENKDMLRIFLLALISH